MISSNKSNRAMQRRGDFLSKYKTYTQYGWRQNKRQWLTDKFRNGSSDFSKIEADNKADRDRMYFGLFIAFSVLAAFVGYMYQIDFMELFPRLQNL